MSHMYLSAAVLLPVMRLYAYIITRKRSPDVSGFGLKALGRVGSGILIHTNLYFDRP